MPICTSITAINSKLSFVDKIKSAPHRHSLSIIHGTEVNKNSEKEKLVTYGGKRIISELIIVPVISLITPKGVPAERTSQFENEK